MAIFSKRIASVILILSAVYAACSTKSTAPTAVGRPPSSGISKEVKLRQQIIIEATKHKGTPYQYAGKDPRGFDCSGFTHYVFLQHNIQLSSSSGAQSKQGKEIAIAKAKKGDLLFFGREGRNGRIQHVGIVYRNGTDGLHMIHSSSKRGIVIDNVTTSKYWQPKLLFARRVIGV